MWGEQQSQTIKALFSELDQKKIDWMVFRNFEGLPDNNDSKDVDLLIRRTHIAKAITVLFATMKKMGYTRYTFDRFQCIWCYSFFKRVGSKWISIKVDLFYGLIFRGSETLSFSQIYDSSVIYHGFRVPNPVMDSFMLWIKPVMTGGVVKDKYVDRILKSAKNDEFLELIEKTFNARVLNEAKKYLVADEICNSACLQHKMRRISWLKSFRRHPITVLKDVVMHYLLEVVRRLKRPSGMITALLGPDGVGKTTIIEKILDEIPDVFIKDIEKIRVFHFRPNILPNLKKLLNKHYDESKENFNNPHRATPDNKINSLFRIIYYWIDYVLGSYKIRKACVDGNIVIFDRYSYDFIVDPLRARISLSDKLISAFMLHVPLPDKAFVLCASPEAIYSRKQELEFEEITRQIDQYKLLAGKRREMVLIDADRSPGDIVDDIMYQWISSFKEL
jgi:thymidylate kinase